MLLLVWMFTPLVQAGDWIPLTQKLAEATNIVIVRYPVAGTIPSRWPNKAWDPRGWGFPDPLSAAARQAATVERVLLDDGRGAVDATTLDNGFTSGGACWWRAHDSGAVRVLVFADRSGPAGAARGLYGVEGDQGMLTDLNPSFDSLIAAVEAAIGWRARAADPTWDWAGPKEAGSSTDPYRRLLAYGVALHAEESAEAAALAESLRGPRGADGRFSGLLQLQAVEQQADWCRTPGAVNR